MIILLFSLIKMYVAPGCFYGTGEYINGGMFNLEVYNYANAELMNGSASLEIIGEYVGYDTLSQFSAHLNRAFISKNAGPLRFFIGMNVYNWTFESVFTPYRYLSSEMYFLDFMPYKRGIPGAGVKYFAEDFSLTFLTLPDMDTLFKDRINNFKFATRMYVFTKRNIELQIPVYYFDKSINAGLGIRARIEDLTLSSDISAEYMEEDFITNIAGGINVTFSNNLFLQAEYLYLDSGFVTFTSITPLIEQIGHNLYISLSKSENLWNTTAFLYYNTDTKMATAACVLSVLVKSFEVGLQMFYYRSENSIDTQGIVGGMKIKFYI